MLIQEICVEDPIWLELLQTVVHDFYHLPSYTLLEAIRNHGKPIGYLIQENTTIQDCWLFIPSILRPIPSSHLFDLTVAYGYSGPLWGPNALKGPDFAKKAIGTWLDHLRVKGIVSVFLRFHPLLPQPNSIWQQFRQTCLVNHGETISVDLTLSLQELWQKIRKGHRYDISKIEKQDDISVFVDEDWAFFEEFVECYISTMDRVNAAPRYYFRRQYFLNLREALGPNLHLCVTRIGEDIASASLFTETCSIIEYHLSGSSSEYTNIPTSKSILYHMITWAKNRGNRVFHLGSGVGGKKDGVFSFKAGFSPLRHPLLTWRAIIDQDVYQTVLDKRRHSVGLPKSHTVTLDDFFPEYRDPCLGDE